MNKIGVRSSLLLRSSHVLTANVRVGRPSLTPADADACYESTTASEDEPVSARFHADFAAAPLPATPGASTFCSHLGL